MTIELQTIIQIVVVLGTGAGAYVQLTNRMVKLEAKNSHLCKQLEEEKTVRKEAVEMLISEMKEDRKAFQAHAKETSKALHELSAAIEGLTGFLKGQIPSRKTRKTSDVSD